MCHLITLATPKGVKPFEPPINPYTGEVFFLLGRHRNEGGGHDYGPKFDVYALGRCCSCGLYGDRPFQWMGQEVVGLLPEVRRYLASNAYRATEIQFIVHLHTG